MDTMRAGLQRCAVPALILALALCLGACGGEPLKLGETRPDPDEAQIAARLIEAVKQASLRQYPEGVLRRFNQPKGHACLAARFAVASDLPVELQQGLFRRGAVYPALVRFASASEFDDTEKDFRGMSIKLSGMAGKLGKPLWGEDGTQDFLLNSHPALFAGTPAHFLAYVEAMRDGATWKYFIDPRHFYSLLIGLKGRAKIASPFDIRYWSTTPYRFGEDKSVAVKYSAAPCSRVSSEEPDKPHPDFLAENIKRHLQQGPACFEFMVQFQTDPQAMPIEDASVEWDEAVSPFRKLATLTIEDQAFDSETARQQCERARFNPWQSLAAHEPIGGINRVRRPIYAELARFRAEENARRGNQ